MPEYPKLGFGGFKAGGSSPSQPDAPGGPRPPGPRFRAPQETRPGTPGSSDAAVSRTTLPTKQHIRCYECAYEFDLTGRMGSTHCPKCRATLDLAGYTIDAECHDTLKTLGKIKITPRALVSGAQLLGTDVDMAGKVTNSSVEASHELILYPGAEFTRGNFKAVDLKIEAGGEAGFRSPALYRNVEVIGALNAPLYATGLVTLRATAVFTGSLYAGHLIVENGAAVAADVNIGPEGLAEAMKMKEQMGANPPGANERIVVAPVAQTAPAE